MKLLDVGCAGSTVTSTHGPHIWPSAKFVMAAATKVHLHALLSIGYATQLAALLQDRMTYLLTPPLSPRFSRAHQTQAVLGSPAFSKDLGAIASLPRREVRGKAERVKLGTRNLKTSHLNTPRCFNFGKARQFVFGPGLCCSDGPCTVPLSEYFPESGLRVPGSCGFHAPLPRSTRRGLGTIPILPGIERFSTAVSKRC